MLTPEKSPSKQIPLAITYHHKFTVISKIIKDIYERIIKRFLETQDIFPVLPVTYSEKLHIQKSYLKQPIWENIGALSFRTVKGIPLLVRNQSLVH